MVKTSPFRVCGHLRKCSTAGARQKRDVPKGELGAEVKLLPRVIARILAAGSPQSRYQPETSEPPKSPSKESAFLSGSRMASSLSPKSVAHISASKGVLNFPSHHSLYAYASSSSAPLHSKYLLRPHFPCTLDESTCLQLGRLHTNSRHSGLL